MQLSHQLCAWLQLLPAPFGPFVTWLDSKRPCTCPWLQQFPTLVPVSIAISGYSPSRFSLHSPFHTNTSR